MIRASLRIALVVHTVALMTVAILTLGAGNIPPFVWLATGHVTVGAATFAAGVVASMQVRRYVG